MAVKSVPLGIVLFSVLLVFQHVAYARVLTEANGAPGLEDEKLLGGYRAGYAGGYIGGGYGTGFGFGYGGGVPFGFVPGYIPFFGGGYGGLGFGGQPLYGR